MEPNWPQIPKKKKIGTGKLPNVAIAVVVLGAILAVVYREFYPEDSKTESPIISIPASDSSKGQNPHTRANCETPAMFPSE